MKNFFTLHNKIRYLLIVLIALMSACKTTQKIAPAIVKENTDYKSTRTLIANLKKNEFKFSFLSAKFTTEAFIDSNTISFNVNLRMQKDSAIWMTINLPLIGIEVARVMITKDSVKFVNRANSSYFVGDYNYINKLLRSELDFLMIQALLVGNSIDFYEEDDKLRSGIDNHKYLSLIHI